MRIKSILAMSAAMLIGSVGHVAAQSNYDKQFVNYPTYSGDDLELMVDATGTHWWLWSHLS